MSIHNWLREVHRRSVWQVTGAYAATSWAVLNVVDVVTGLAGLPDWTPSMAIVLLMLGFPVIIATAVIQGGLQRNLQQTDDPSLPGPVPLSAQTAPSPTNRGLLALFTWRNALLGGVGAGVLLAASGTIYLAMWSLGIGPTGSLVAQGVLEARDPILLAQFDDRTSRGDLGVIVSEALAVDLGTSPVVTIVGEEATANALRLMEKDERQPVTSDMAREVSLRANVKAYIEGEITPVGSRFLVVARIVRADSGEVLGSFREEASDEDGLLPAIDRLSQRLRERLGESLKDIRLGAPLEEVTTPSFEALRKLSQAEAAEEEGDYPLAERLLQEAVGLDEGFAMAYRKLSVLISNRGGPVELAQDAATRAFEFRHRLTDRERYLTEANFYNEVEHDQAAALRAYDALLRLYPGDPAALNNSGLALRRLSRDSEAQDRFAAAVAKPESHSAVAFANYSMALLQNGDSVGALAAVEAYRAAYPYHIMQQLTDLVETLAAGEVEGVEGRIRALQTSSDNPHWRQTLAPLFGMSLAVQRGSLDRAFEWSEILMPQWNGVNAGIRGISVGAADLWFWLLDDAEGASAALVDAYSGPFQAVDAELRLWGAFIGLQAMAGEGDLARQWLMDWDAEALAVDVTNVANRTVAQAMIRASEGEAEAALREIEQAEEDLECPRCFELYRGWLLEKLERHSDAVEVWELVRDRPSMIVGGYERALAHKNLARLYELVGRSDDAIAANLAVVATWEFADSRMQPQVSRAKEAIVRLQR